MFNQQNVNQTAAYKEEVKEPLAPSIINRIAGVQNEQCNALYEIENKLHNILNLRVPEKESIPAQPKDINSDFSSSINEGIYQMYNIRDRLERILKHLNQIIYYANNICFNYFMAIGFDTSEENFFL